MQIRFRRGTSALWSSANPILAAGEPGVEFATDGTNKLKIGDGVKNWAQLPYALGSGTPTGDYVTTAAQTSYVASAISALGVQASGKHPDSYFATPAQATTLATAAANAAVSSLVAGAPAALDTLDEIAAALNDDTNFAATMTGLITQLKLQLTVNVTRTVSNEAAPTANNWPARSGFLAFKNVNYTGQLPAPVDMLAGDTMDIVPSS